MNDPKRDQIEITERLQHKLLRRMEQILDDALAGDYKLSGAEMNTIAVLLLRNGWSLDPSMIPEGLREKLTSLKPDFLDDEPSLEEVTGRPFEA